jgi:MOSC domain-containing protein YiiM
MGLPDGIRQVMGVIYSIVYQPIEGEDRSRSPEFLRVPVQQANLIAGHGIEGDRKAGHHPGRQINLLSREWLLRLQDAGYQIEPGQFGEQITLLGIELEELRVGEQLQLGPTACIEIRQARTPCGRLAVAQQLAVAGLKTIGLMATVVVGGTIRVGDAVIVRRVTHHPNSRQNQVPANTGSS